MDTTERAHRTTNSSTSEVFICFASRLSSSSMKLSSKSILSPSRTREQSQISLSSSLSRRLRSNGSIRGGQASPMFPTGGKKRGCAFENPEPSSPKVTCIGQVRVKTMKQGKKMRARSKRRGEASFRKTEQNFQVTAANPDLSRQNSQSFQYQNHQNLQAESFPHRNQRWVHLPMTICEALRAFGAEFNCFFPCRSSCMSTEREKEKAARAEGSTCGHARESSCGAAFARWLVAMQEGDAKGREVELVVDEEDRTNRPERSQRRHVFEDIDISIEKKKEDSAGEEEEKARVSICIPPKNALLLMRCRSDPVKMAALGNRFWESPVKKDEDEDEDEDEEEDNQDAEGEEEQIHIEEDEEGQTTIEAPKEVKEDCICEKGVTFVDCEAHVIPVADLEAKPVAEGNEIETGANGEINYISEANQENAVEEEGKGIEDGRGNVNQQDETLMGVSSPEVQVDLEKPKIEGFLPNLLQETKEKLNEIENDEDGWNEQRSSELASCLVVSVASESENKEAAAAITATALMAETSEATEESTEEKETTERRSEEKETTERLSEGDETTQRLSDEKETTERLSEGEETRERLSNEEETATQHDRFQYPKFHELTAGVEELKEEENKKSERGSSVLPECLLLMMCEPKLSMEVSKETWVCSTDFIRWHPGKSVKKKQVADEPKKKINIVSNPLPPPPPPALLQPPRSSCSFPAAQAGMSMATMIEQKLVGSKAYEPFVLTRCKSEPMRSSAKLVPDACFWKNRNLEPHPPATLGVGAAGVGF